MGEVDLLKNQLSEKTNVDKNSHLADRERRVNLIVMNCSKILCSGNKSINEFFFPYKKDTEEDKKDVVDKNDDENNDYSLDFTGGGDSDIKELLASVEK